MSKKIPHLPVKPLRWVGPSKAELMEFPEAVRKVVGHALHVAQTGGKADDAKPLHGFGGAGVLEVVEEHAGRAYRAVYTVKLARTVYVLHCFQKKSKRGIETPKSTVDLIKQRLRIAIESHERQKRSENHEKSEKQSRARGRHREQRQRLWRSRGQGCRRLLG